MLKNRVIVLVCCALALLSVDVAADGLNQALNNIKDKSLRECLDSHATKNGWSQVSNFTSLTCHSMGVSDLEGLEQFSALQKISFHKNRIKRFNFTARDFPKLEELNLGRNQLKELRVKHFSDLKRIFAFGNQLREIELVNLTQLSQIKINNNRLDEVNYRNLPTLKKVYLFNNNVEFIDIYNLPKLVYMDARQNPMPDALYDEMDLMKNVIFLHDGNANDW